MNKFFKNKLVLVIALAILVSLAISIYQNIQASKYGKFVKISDMNVPRVNPYTFLLKDGRILILEGDVVTTEIKFPNGGNLIAPVKVANSAEVFDPKTNKFTLKKGLNEDIGSYTAVLLNNDKLLITGGDRYHGHSSEIYDPITDKLGKGPNIKIFRSGSSSVLLKDGRVLVFGSPTTVKAEIYDPRLNKFILLKNPTNFTYSNPAFTYTLSNGKVFIADKYGNNNHAEIFDPKTNKFEIIKNINIGCPKLGLNNDRILTFKTLKKGSGTSWISPIRYYTTLNIYKVQKDFKLQKIQSLILKGDEDNLGSASMIQLDNNRILLMGGIRGQAGIFIVWDTDASYIYDLKKNKLLKIENMIVRRSLHGCIKVDKNKILIVGGESQKNPVSDKYTTNKAEMFIYK